MNAGAFLEDFRDPERQAKIERSRSMKCKARAARLIGVGSPGLSVFVA